MIHKSDNTPGQMEATASTAEGKKKRARFYKKAKENNLNDKA